MTTLLAVKHAVALAFVYAVLFSSRCAAQNALGDSRPNEVNARICGENRFKCRNGECIRNELVCDGRTDCSDQSDETQIECSKPELTCPDYAFRCTYGACVNGDATCNGVDDCADGSDEDPLLCHRPKRSPLVNTIPALSSSTAKSCIVPPQPSNGRRQLHPDECGNLGTDCKVSADVPLDAGTHLVYICNPSFQIRGRRDVFCGLNGKWSSIPVCIEIRCRSLNTVSTRAICRRNGRPLNNCDSGLLPGTVAKLNCRNGYTRDITDITLRREDVECNAAGNWDPDPIRCIPGPLTIYVEIEEGVLKVRAKSAENATGVNLIDVTSDRVIVYTGKHGDADIIPNIDVRLDSRISVKGKISTRRRGNPVWF